MGGPNYRGLAVARKAGAAVRESRFLRGLCTGATWAFLIMRHASRQHARAASSRLHSFPLLLLPLLLLRGRAAYLLLRCLTPPRRSRSGEHNIRSLWVTMRRDADAAGALRAARGECGEREPLALTRSWERPWLKRSTFRKAVNCIASSTAVRTC